MSDAAENDDGRKPPRPGERGISGWRALPAVAVLFHTIRAMNERTRALDPEDAGIVGLGPRASKVADRASALAGSRREDEQAVAELVALAGGRKRTLERAERFSRQDASHCEDPAANRMHRLLVAAIHGRPVEPPTSDQEHIFKVVKRFRALSPEKAWAALVAAEPRLAELETETRRGAFTTSGPEIGDRSETVRRVLHEQTLARSELGDRLRAIVGPIATTDEPLLKSRAALAVAMTHLAEIDWDASS